jgi:hypothetical protein
METLDAILRFAGSYPMWARVLVLVCISVSVATLILAPRTSTPQPAKPSTAASDAPKKEQQVFMRIKPIKLFPDNSNAEVQLLVYVNGTEYRHPSVGGVEWMKTGTSMSEKIIELPTSARYDVRFEMKLREGPTLKTRQQASQQITLLKRCRTARNTGSIKLRTRRGPLGSRRSSRMKSTCNDA